jgi:hypothetical protein
MSSTIVKERTYLKLDKVAKEEAKCIFNQLGLTMGEAFNLFLQQVSKRRVGRSETETHHHTVGIWWVSTSFLPTLHLLFFFGYTGKR